MVVEELAGGSDCWAKWGVSEAFIVQVILPFSFRIQITSFFCYTVSLLYEFPFFFQKLIH